jgi:prophage DNA circulation protein
MAFDDLAHVSPPWLALTDAEVDALPSFEKARIQTRRAPSALREDRTLRQFSSVFRTAVLTAAAIAVADMQLDTRRDGIRVRADMAERFDELLAEVDDPDHAEAIREVQGLVSDYVSQRNISLAPIGTIEAQESLPVLHWAYQLYENPNRARELVALNTIQAPDRMPTRFEARKL